MNNNGCLLVLLAIFISLFIGFLVGGVIGESIDQGIKEDLNIDWSDESSGKLVIIEYMREIKLLDGTPAWYIIYNMPGNNASKDYCISKKIVEPGKFFVKNGKLEKVEEADGSAAEPTAEGEN